MPNCKRCGQCCHYEIDNGVWRKCKFLIKLPSGKTICRIYKQRLGTIIDVYRGKIVFCIKREDDNRNFPGCPYNKPLQSDKQILNIQKTFKKI